MADTQTSDSSYKLDLEALFLLLAALRLLLLLDSNFEIKRRLIIQVCRRGRPEVRSVAVSRAAGAGPALVFCQALPDVDQRAAGEGKNDKRKPSLGFVARLRSRLPC